jgi:hypothetical protein
MFPDRLLNVGPNEQGWSTMAKFIRVEKMERAQGSKMLFRFDLHTSVGQLPIEMIVDDLGTTGESEKRALLELQTLLEEALEMVRNKLI